MPGNASLGHSGQLRGRDWVDDAEVAIPLVGGHQHRLYRRVRSRGGIPHQQAYRQDQAKRGKYIQDGGLIHVLGGKNYIRQHTSSPGSERISWFDPQMTQTHAKLPTKQTAKAQPVWPAVAAILAVGGLHLALPEPLTFGPSWLLLAVVAVLLVPVLIARMRGSFDLNQKLGYVLLGVVTAAMLWSLALLVWSLPRHTLPPSMLLRSAAALWVTNILVFASWYWRLDAGGPHARRVSVCHTKEDFLFPANDPRPGDFECG